MEAKNKKSHIVLEEDLTIDYDSVIGGHETLKTIGILLTPKVFKEYLDAIESLFKNISDEFRGYFGLAFLQGSRRFSSLNRG